MKYNCLALSDRCQYCWSSGTLMVATSQRLTSPRDPSGFGPCMVHCNDASLHPCMQRSEQILTSVMADAKSRCLLEGVKAITNLSEAVGHSYSAALE